MLLQHEYLDTLCQACFVVRGLEAMVEMNSNRTQQSLIERLLSLSQQAHQRGQTDAAYHALTAAYHAAYEPEHLAAIIHEAQQRAAEWETTLDECGEVRIEDYHDLIADAQEMKDNVIPLIGEKPV
jgi:acetylornithine deacetylase/succinyl-diaminopimelate desuccinylase-like protein